MKNFFYICFFCALAPVSAAAQSLLNSDGTVVTDQYGERVDNGDSLRHDDDKVVPVDVRQWTIDRRFGDRTAVDADTARINFYNTVFPEGMTGHYNHIGTLGSPRISRIYMEREHNTNMFFTDPLDFFMTKPTNYLFSDTKSPYTNITYHSAGDKNDGDDWLTIKFATSANKYWGGGFKFDYLYSRGFYVSQSSSYMNGSLHLYHLGDKYQMQFLYSHNHMKMAENGGLTDDYYIIDPSRFSRSYNSTDIPTYLERNLWQRNDNNLIFLTHRYNLGFHREVGDSVNKKLEFVPVTSFIHTLDIQNNDHVLVGGNIPANFIDSIYNPNKLLGNDINDKAKTLLVKNTFAISLLEGFNKYAVAGIKAFISHEFRRFGYQTWRQTKSVEYLFSDYTADHVYESYIDPTMKYDTQNDVRIGGQLVRAHGEHVNYNVTGEYAITGDNFGEYNLNGNADLNVKVLNDTLGLHVSGLIDNFAPSYYMTTFSSRLKSWGTSRDAKFSLDNMTRMRLQGTLSSERTRTRLTAAVENIKNYAYFYNDSNTQRDNNGLITAYNNSVAVGQYDKNIQIVSAKLEQNFKLGVFHLDNEVTYQYTKDDNIIPLPSWNFYHNFYVDVALSHKVLKLQMGVDLKYFTKYYAPEYSPIVGQYMNQGLNEADRVKIGGFPFANAYMNFFLKRLRFYVTYTNLFEGSGNSMNFTVPHYAMNPSMLRFGLSWNFYD